LVNTKGSFEVVREGAKEAVEELSSDD